MFLSPNIYGPLLAPKFAQSAPDDIWPEGARMTRGLSSSVVIERKSVKRKVCFYCLYRD